MTFRPDLHNIRLPILMKDSKEYFIYPMGFTTENPPTIYTIIPESTDTITVLFDRNTTEAFSVDIMDENTTHYRGFCIEDTGYGSAPLALTDSEGKHPDRYDLIDALYYIDMYLASKENPDVKLSFENLYHKKGE